MGSQLGSSGLRATVSRQGLAISRRIAMNHAGWYELVGNPEISCQKSRLSIALDWVPDSGSGPVETTDISKEAVHARYHDVHDPVRINRRVQRLGDGR